MSKLLSTFFYFLIVIPLPFNNLLAETKRVPYGVNIKNKNIFLKKEALNTQKPFLLHQATRDKKISPSFSSNKSKIVYFIKKGNKLELREDLTGQSIETKQEPSLITTFSITKEDNDYVHFDTNSLLKDVSIINEMFVSDFQSRNFQNYDLYLESSDITTDQTSLSHNTGILTIQKSVVIKEVITITGRPSIINKTPIDLIFYLQEIDEEKMKFDNFSSKDNYFFDSKNLNLFVSFEEQDFRKRLSTDGGKGLKIVKRYKINIVFLNYLYHY